MAKEKGIAASTEDEQYDLTPMIDIVFLLIAFFMVVAKLIDDTKIDIDVPIADQSKINKEQLNRVTVSVPADGSVYWASQKLGSPEEVTRFIEEARRAKGEQIEVYLRADSNTAHKHVRDVMKAVALGGVFDVKFAAYENR